MAELVDDYGNRFLPIYECVERDLRNARAREAEGRSALSRAKGRARDARLRRDPQVAAMLA